MLSSLSSTPSKSPSALKALKLTSEHLLKFGIVDEAIPEPRGGAHHDPKLVASNLKKTLFKNVRIPNFTF